MKNCTWGFTVTGYAGGSGTLARWWTESLVDSANASAIGSRSASLCSTASASFKADSDASSARGSVELRSTVVGSPSEVGYTVMRDGSTMSDSAAAGAGAPDAKTRKKTTEMPGKWGRIAI